MKLSLLTAYLESLAPLSYQEDYDNSGLIVGNPDKEVHQALISLDCTEAIVDEAIAKNCEVIISHHPIVFRGLKKLNGKTYVERVVEKAIKNDIAIYAIHTNLDNVMEGVNKKICDIGNYSECSFNAEGTGTFKGGEDTTPYVGEPGKRHYENEIRIETVYPAAIESKLLMALFLAHPYEEVAYDLYTLSNQHQQVGSGMIGELEEEMTDEEFLFVIKQNMQTKVIRHTALTGKKVKRVAVCGGSGSFLLKYALSAGADFFVTADFKYHEFFDAEGKLVIADIGHFESEQFTVQLLHDIIQKKFPNFAVRLTEISTNPVKYFI
jgi:dinuclear metal center YbgI/SA1388 family protein